VPFLVLLIFIYNKQKLHTGIRVSSLAIVMTYQTSYKIQPDNSLSIILYTVQDYSHSIMKNCKVRYSEHVLQHYGCIPKPSEGSEVNRISQAN